MWSGRPSSERVADSPRSPGCCGHERGRRTTSFSDVPGTGTPFALPVEEFDVRARLSRDVAHRRLNALNAATGRDRSPTSLDSESRSPPGEASRAAQRNGTQPGASVGRVARGPDDFPPGRCSTNRERRSSARAPLLRRRYSARGSASITGLNGRMSHPRNPQTTCARSGPPPPSVTSIGAARVDICRKNSSTASPGRLDRRPGALAIKYGSPWGMTSTSPAFRRTGASPGSAAQQEPRLMMWYDTTCWAPGSTMEAKSVAFGISWTHGEDTSIGKNNAPVSLTVRRTSDRTSTVAAGESLRPARRLDAGADNTDDPSWRLDTARSYIRRAGSEDAHGDSARTRSNDVGVGRLSPVCDGDGVGAGACAGHRVPDFARVSGCSTSPPARAMSPFGPRRRGRSSSRRISRPNTSTPAGALRARRASISNGSKATRNRFPSPMRSSMSSPRASGRCSPLLHGGWRR